jgi:hypothetical protein
LVGAPRHQENDVKKISAAVTLGNKKGQDFIVAGNAIDGVQRNGVKFLNFMLDEKHSAYVACRQGSNFATE